MTDIAFAALFIAVGFCLGMSTLHLQAGREDETLAAVWERLCRDERRCHAETRARLAERETQIVEMFAEQTAAAVTVAQLSAALHQAVGDRGGAAVITGNVVERFSRN